MEAEDDEDIYGSGGTGGMSSAIGRSGLGTSSQHVENGHKPADLEEGEEEDEDEEEESDSVIRCPSTVSRQQLTFYRISISSPSTRKSQNPNRSRAVV